MDQTVPSAAVKLRTCCQRALSAFVGWVADRKIPGPLRGPLYRGFARATGAQLEEARGPLSIYPSLSAFFVRQLVDGARPVDPAPEVLVSPVDGTVQAIEPVDEGRVVQAKGRDYALRTLLAGVGEDLDLEGAMAWTLYLGPRDYHRIHTPEAGHLVEARWVPGSRFSVAPSVLARQTVLSINERCVLRLETQRGPVLMVLVGALNVGRIRVTGVPPGENTRLSRAVARGEELARFELGSTVVLITPPGAAQPSDGVFEGQPVRQGANLGRWRT
jgi:phosphatidylserine decarboxylase